MSKTTNKKTIIKLLHLLMPFWRKIFFLTICLVLLSGLTFCRPAIIQRIIDDGMQTNNFDAIVLYAGLLVCLAFLEQGMEILQSYNFLILQNDFQLNLYKKIFIHLLRLPINYFEKRNSSEIISFINTDINRVSMIADRSVLLFLNNLFKVISGIIGLILIDIRLTFIVLLVIPIKAIVINILSKKRSDATKEVIETGRCFSAWFADVINGIVEVKLWNLYNRKTHSFIDKQKDLLDKNKKFSMLDILNSGISNIIEWLLTSFLYLIGGWYICRGELTIGSIVAFISYSSYVTVPLTSLLGLKFIFSGILPSAQRLFEFLELKSEKIKGIKVKGKFSNLTIEDVKFYYTPKKMVLEGLNLSIKNGEKIAIIGENGSGKSTLLNLILRFYSPCSGVIKLNGEDIRKYSINAYRDLFAVVSQDIYLFNETLLDNLLYKDETNSEDLDGICRKLGISKLIKSNSQGYHMMVDDNGKNFSGGEKRKIAFIRAAVKNAPIIVLDEPTANYDNESIENLNKVLFQEFKDKTIILITHDYSCLEGMDKIYRLSKGKLNLIRER